MFDKLVFVLGHSPPFHCHCAKRVQRSLLLRGVTPISSLNIYIIRHTQYKPARSQCAFTSSQSADLVQFFKCTAVNPFIVAHRTHLIHGNRPDRFSYSCNWIIFFYLFFFGSLLPAFLETTADRIQASS